MSETIERRGRRIDCAKTGERCNVRTNDGCIECPSCDRKYKVA